MKTEELLYDVSAKDVPFILNKGFSWFNEILLPSVQNIGSIDTHTHSVLWYLIGDVYDMLDAPLKALEAYQQSISIDASNYASYREAANMFEQMGRYREALDYINKALAINPSDSNSLTDKEGIEDDIKFKNESLFNPSDQIWQMNENLANNRFELVIDILSSAYEIDFLKILAKGYGALNMKEEYLKVWQKIEKTDQSFELSYGDWFYMPKDVYHSNEIWYMFKSLNNRIKPSVFIHFDTLDKYYKDHLTREEYKTLICDYNIFCNEDNVEQLSKMKERFPKWKELSNDNYTK